MNNLAGTLRRNAIRWLVALALPIFATAQSGRAADYHVNAARGDDTRDGLTPDSAWKSLDKINAVQLAPGDSVLFAAGAVFKGQFKPQGQGSATDPITIGMYGQGDPPRIEGEGRFVATVHLFNTQYITVQDLHLTNKGESPIGERRGILVELSNFGIARNITLRRLTITDVNGSPDKKAGNGGAIMCKNGGDATKSRFDGLYIEHNYIARTQRNGINMGSAYAARDKWFPSTGVVIRNNLLEEVPGDGIVPIGCDGALVESNVIRKGAFLDSKDNSAAAGIWPWSCDNTVVQYNEVSEQNQTWDGQGFDSDWNCRNTIIQYNYSHDNVGGFLLVCNTGKPRLVPNDGNLGTVVRYNVSFNDGLRKAGPVSKPNIITSPVIRVNGPVDGVEIYGNLIIAPKKASPNVDTHLVSIQNWNGMGKNVLISRNLFIVEQAASFVILEGATNCVIKDNRAFGPVANDAGQVKILSDSPLRKPFEHPGPGLVNALKLLKAAGVE